MSTKTLSFILVTVSLGFTSFALTRTPAAVEPAAAVAPSDYRHELARARNGSTQKSIAQVAPPMAGGGQGGGGSGFGLGYGGGTGMAPSFDGGSGAGSTGDQSALPH